MNTTKLVFVSFADSRMSAAIERIRKQAEEMGIFDEIHVWNEHDLDASFREKWAHVLKPDIRGYGYWIWKPFTIHKILSNLPEESIIIYCDAGCHLNPQGIKKLRFYIDELHKTPLGVKAFNSYFSLLEVVEKRWTKGDVFDYFNCRNNKSITDTLQLAAGHVLYRKCASALKFLETWMRVWEDDITLLDDSPSKSPNFPEFIEGRHDQSVFSVLYKLSGGTALPATETIPLGDMDKTKHPILAVRDRGYKDKRLFPRIKRYIQAKIFMSKVKRQIKLQELSQGGFDLKTQTNKEKA